MRDYNFEVYVITVSYSREDEGEPIAVFDKQEEAINLKHTIQKADPIKHVQIHNCGYYQGEN